MNIFFKISITALVSIVTAFTVNLATPWTVALSNKATPNQKKSKPTVKDTSYTTSPITRGNPSVRQIKSKPIDHMYEYSCVLTFLPFLSGQILTVPSKALPYGSTRAPAILDGSAPGDVGFDPVFFSVKGRTDWAKYFNGITMGNDIDGFMWLREAELMNGRNAMMGVLGMIVPGLIGKTGNPLEVSGSELFPVFLAMAWVEWFRINNILKEGSNYRAGDMLKWGPGDGNDRYNPFGLVYTPEEFSKIQLSEVKHCRLAMIGFLGLYLQAAISGTDVVTQLSNALSMPEYLLKVGDFMPEGI